MGNQSSASLFRACRERQGTVQLIGEQDEDRVTLTHDSDHPEFSGVRRRKIALYGILVCQLFDWVAFTIVTFWIPQTLELNVYFFNKDDKGVDGYYDYIYRYVCTGIVLYYIRIFSYVMGISMVLLAR